MINFLIATVLFLVVLILIIYLFRSMTNPIYVSRDGFADEEETVTTTTTTTTVSEPAPAAQPTIDQLPTLERHFKANGQPYVIDPVDHTEWMLNTNDDMYEDAADKWWRLVDATPKV